MAPLHHHFELIGWSGAEGHHAVPDPRDHLRAVQSHHVEAAGDGDDASTCTANAWSSSAAARSGVAAAELLVSPRRARDADRRARRCSRTPTAARAGRRRSSSARIARDAFTAADLVVLSPGVPPRQPALEAARARRRARSSARSSWRRAGCPAASIAITGTKGKSTTTTLTGADAARRRASTCTAGGNIGTALSAQVDESTRRRAPRRRGRAASSSRATDTFHPWIAVLLNLSPDHLDRHATFEEYARGQGADLREPDAGRLGGASTPTIPASLALARGGARAPVRLRARRRCCATASTVDGDAIVRRTRGGRDAADAAVVGAAAGPAPARRRAGGRGGRRALAGVAAGGDARARSKASRGLEHALERVAEIGGVRFVNDSKATNIESARRAIESFDGGVVAIMGGRFKGGDFADLRDAAGARAARRRRDRRGRAADSRGARRTRRRCTTRASMARRRADARSRSAPPGGMVLLAPACSSFDMFRDYAERGRAFKAAKCGRGWQAKEVRSGQTREQVSSHQSGSVR